MGEDEVRKVLEAEYKLLCLCDTFKNAFDEVAHSEGVTTIPGKLNSILPPSCERFVTQNRLSTEFYFNFEGSIFGKVIPSPTSGSRPLPHKYFLATRLLPCGPHDPKIQKFTGNGTIGPAEDHLTKAIHAFVHFSLIYSGNDVLICDLQGDYNYSLLFGVLSQAAHFIL